jgi:hypothetical protein
MTIRAGITALTALSLSLAPALAAPAAPAKKKPAAASLAGAFTPAAADPRLAAAFAGRGVVGGTFRFTPSSSSNRSKAVQVAVRARVATPAQARRSAVEPTPSALTSLAPTAYNLGVAIGWKRFALSGDVAKIDGGLLPLNRESAELGLSYSLHRFTGRVKVAAERNDGRPLQLIPQENAVSFDVGGSYTIAHNFDVTGGLRYRIQHDRLQSLADERRDSQAVYVGTAFRF